MLRSRADADRCRLPGAAVAAFCVTSRRTVHGRRHDASVRWASTRQPRCAAWPGDEFRSRNIPSPPPSHRTDGSVRRGLGFTVGSACVGRGSEAAADTLILRVERSDLVGPRRLSRSTGGHLRFLGVRRAHRTHIPNAVTEAGVSARTAVPCMSTSRKEHRRCSLQSKVPPSPRQSPTADQPHAEDPSRSKRADALRRGR